MSREIEIFGAIFMLLSILVFSVFFGIYSSQLNFDVRNEAAGNTIFLSSGDDLQAAIDRAANNDAIFLNSGSYTTSTTTGFKIANKKIRILGAGAKFSTINVNNSSDYGFNITNSDVHFESVKITGAKKDGILVDSGAQSKLSLFAVNVENNVASGVNSAAPTEIKKSTFDLNGDGIIVTNTTNIENTVIRNSKKNGINIASTSGSETKLQNVLLNNNTGSAIAISASSRATINNITAATNGSGIVEAANTSTTIIKNSIIQGSGGIGVDLKNSASKITYSNSNQNTGGNYAPATLGAAEGNLTVGASFTTSSDFKLVAGSALKDKGEPTAADADGSRIDMGAFGGKPDLLGANSIPSVTSTPEEFIKPGQTYSYEIKATDADNDALSYIVLNNNIPRWLKLEANKISGTPSTSDIGYYGVLVVVSDRKGGNVVHPISINVLPEGRDVPTAQPTVDPTAVPTNNPTPTPTQTPTAVTPKITILSPVANTIFSKDNKEIKWALNQGAKVDSYEIKYSTDNQNFTTITTLPGSVTSYSWSDVEKLTSGKYVVRIEAKDTSTPPVTIGITSEQFEVKNESSVNPDKISITKNNPEDNDVTDQKRPLIQVEFTVDGKPEGVQLDLDKTFIKVNGTNVEYKTTNSTIYYEPKSDFTESRVSVEVEIVTLNGGKASKQWGFNIAGTSNPQNTAPTVTSQQTIFGLDRNIGLGIIAILIIILLLLILYFVVRFINTLRDQRQGNLEAEFTEYYDSSVYPQPQQNQQATATLPDPSTNTGQTDMNQYYATDQTQVDPNQQTQVDQSSQTPVALEDYSQQQVDPNQPQQAQSQYQQDQVANQQQDQAQYVDQAAQVDPNQPATYDQNQQQVAYDPNQAQQVQDPNTYQVSQQDQGQVVDPNQSLQQNSGQVDNSGQPNEVADGNKQYIEDLKKKYGLDGQQTAQSGSGTNQPQA